uniref:Uncharacterized protein n=1 Tax=Anguilla anguilla TaxID=7936 RepID=A0A0E9SZ53_ANGAN
MPPNTNKVYVNCWPQLYVHQRMALGTMSVTTEKLSQWLFFTGK